MKKQERAQYILKKLNQLYPTTPIPLDHKDPYTLLISVLLSAQCTDVRVNKTTPALWKLADNPQDMSRQDVKDVENIVRPCGLGPQKSKAIVELSRLLIEKTRE